VKPSEDFHLECGFAGVLVSLVIVTPAQRRSRLLATPLTSHNTALRRNPDLGRSARVVRNLLAQRYRAALSI
jgi:hypothetical protein